MAKVIYRYANIPLTILLALNAFFSAYSIQESINHVFPLLVDVILLYLMNRYYRKIYKGFPFYIEADHATIIGTDFSFSNKRVEIRINEIEKISGGIFSGKPTKPIIITDKNGNSIGIFQHLKDFNRLLTLVLSNIPKSLYDELMQQTKELLDASSVMKKIKKKKTTGKNKKGK